MNVNFLAVGLTGLMLGATTSASPLNLGGPAARAPLGPGPVEHWFASSYLDSTCGGGAFQNFSGSGGSCNVIEHTKPPAEFVVQIQSILIGSVFGNYDFTFLPDTTCEITGIADIIHEVTSGETECVDISGLDAGSFNVAPLATTLKPRLLPESTWDAVFFSDETCGGVQTASFSGSSSQCVLSDGLLQSPLPSTESKSILVSANFASYDFSFFQNEICEDTGILERVYEVTSGDSLCVTYSDAVSFEVTDITTASKRSTDASLETRQGGPEYFWEASTFASTNCGGVAVESLTGAGSVCDVVTPNFLEAIGSVLISSASGEYAFSFYGNTECQVGPFNQELYDISAGQSLCVTLPTGLDLSSISVEELVAPSRK